MLPQTESFGEAIEDEDQLYRRVFPGFLKNHGRISSAAFKTKGDLSVDIARLTTPHKSLYGYPDHGLSTLSALTFRKEDNLEIYHVPTSCNYAHALVYGKITEAMAKRIASSAKLVCENLASLQDPANMNK
jgi:hypothetical protein